MKMAMKDMICLLAADRTPLSAGVFFSDTAIYIEVFKDVKILLCPAGRK